MRLCSLLLTVTLIGPSALSLLCDWTCAAKHQVAGAAAGGCHQHDHESSSPTLQPGHVCHDLTTSPVSIVRNAPQVEPAVLAVGDLTLTDASADSRDRATARRRGFSHAPPPLLLTLRI